jgi:hypothetical protein
MTKFADEVANLRRAVAEMSGVASLDSVRAVAAVEAAAPRECVAPPIVLAMRQDNADVFATIGRHLDAIGDSILDRIDFIDAFDWPGVCAARSGIEYLIAHAEHGVPETDALRRALTQLDAELRHAGAAFGPVHDAWSMAGIPPHHWWWWHPQQPSIGLVVEHARRLTDARIAGTRPGSSVDAMLQSIRAQLAFLADTVAADRPLTIDEVNRLTLGVIAVREFEVTDPDYCDALTDVASCARALA